MRDDPNNGCEGDDTLRRALFLVWLQLYKSVLFSLTVYSYSMNKLNHPPVIKMHVEVHLLDIDYFCDHSSHYCYRLSFRKVNNNRMYFGANQCNKYPSCGLSQTLRINDDLPIVVDGKRRSWLPPSMWVPLRCQLWKYSSKSR